MSRLPWLLLQLGVFLAVFGGLMWPGFPGATLVP